MNAKAKDYENTLFAEQLNKEKREPIQAFISPALKADLEKLAKNDGTNMSNFIRLTLEDFIKSRRVQDVLRRLDGRTRTSKKKKESAHQKLL